MRNDMRDWMVFPTLSGVFNVCERVGSDEVLICQVTSERDANLIAAAPQMLAALKSLMTANPENSDVEFNKAAIAARAADNGR